MDKRISDLIAVKDENVAQNAAKKLIQTQDVKEFENLCNKMDFLFDFVRENVYKRLSKVINENNFLNIFSFFKIYSPYFDDFFTSVLAKYADEDLTDRVLESFEKGDNSQKAYCAGYFKRIPDTVAKENLISGLETDFEPLFLNCAEALGKMKDENTYNQYIEYLKSDDEFTKLKAIKFLVAYGDINILEKLLETMQTSSMSENIAGEIANIIPPFELFNMDFSKGAILFNNLINGLGEILPLENIFYYEVSEITDFLIENKDNENAAVLLFNLKNKMNILTQNDEYTFDLDKDIKNELINIKNKLNKSNIWQKEKALLSSHINENSPFLSTVLNIIREENFKEFSDKIATLTTSSNETIICEAIFTLKELGSLDKVDKNSLSIKNSNLKAIIESYFK